MAIPLPDYLELWIFRYLLSCQMPAFSSPKWTNNYGCFNNPTTHLSPLKTTFRIFRRLHRALAAIDNHSNLKTSGQRFFYSRFSTFKEKNRIWSPTINLASIKIWKLNSSRDLRFFSSFSMNYKILILFLLISDCK